MQRVGQYLVDIYLDDAFKERSNDNVHQYDSVYFFDEDRYICATMLGIKVFKDDVVLASAIIGSVGGRTGVYDTTVVYEDTRIVVCCSDSIFCLSIPELELLWRTQADTATCFEVFKYKDSYIVHGELEISRLDKNGQILWQQGGADIFITLGDGKDFELKEDHIIARDYENSVYKFDYDGNHLI